MIMENGIGKRYGGRKEWMEVMEERYGRKAWKEDMKWSFGSKKYMEGKSMECGIKGRKQC